MKTSHNNCIIDSVYVGEVKCDVVGSGPLEAKIGFAKKNYERLGYTHMNKWSEETLRRFEALVESMEADALAKYFGDTTGGGGIPVSTTTGGVNEL